MRCAYFQKIAVHFQKAGYQTEHVNRILDGSESPDSAIAQWADAHDFVVLTKDADFQNSHFLKNTPRKLVKIGLGNVSNSQLLELLERNWLLLLKLNEESKFFLEISPTGLTIFT